MQTFGTTLSLSTSAWFYFFRLYALVFILFKNSVVKDAGIGYSAADLCKRALKLFPIFDSGETGKLLDSGLTVFKLVRRMSCSNVFGVSTNNGRRFKKCALNTCVYGQIESEKKTIECNGKPLLPTDNEQRGREKKVY